MELARKKEKATSEKPEIARLKTIQNENGGENRTRTCKPVRAVVFKTTALPIMLSLRTAWAKNKIYRKARLITTPDRNR